MHRLHADEPEKAGVVPVREHSYFGRSAIQEVQAADVALALEGEAADAVAGQARQGVVAAAQWHVVICRFGAAVRIAVKSQKAQAVPGRSE